MPKNELIMHRGNYINHRLRVKTQEEINLSAEILKKIHKIIQRYPQGKQKSALLPVLHLVQEEFGSHLSVNLMDKVAEILSIQAIEVYEVASFYSQFNLDKPGKYVLEVCHTAPCAICGGDDIVDYLKEKLQIEVGETSADGLFTLKTVECLGACGYAPVMQVDTEFIENLDTEKIDQLIETLKKQTEKPHELRWAERFF